MTTLPLEAIGDNLFLASSNSWWLPTFLDLWLHHVSLQGQHLQIPLCSIFTFLYVSNLPLPLSLKDTCD